MWKTSRRVVDRLWITRFESLATEAGIAVFKVAFQRWADQPADSAGQTLAHFIRQSLAELKTVTAEV